MDTAERILWHERRETLFKTKIPVSALIVINEALPALDYAAACCALDNYAEERPYKGFYMHRFMVHYNRKSPVQRDRDGAPKGAALPAGFVTDAAQTAEDEQAYRNIPAAKLEEYRTRFRDWGWKEGTPYWRILCVDAFAGKDVERYRVAPSYFSAEGQRAVMQDMASLQRECLRLQSLVEKLRMASKPGQ